MAMDLVDFEIKGSEMQYVEIELEPGEAAVGEAGSVPGGFGAAGALGGLLGGDDDD